MDLRKRSGLAMAGMSTSSSPVPCNVLAEVQKSAKEPLVYIDLFDCRELDLIGMPSKEASLDDDPITRHSDLGCPDRHHNSKEYGYSHASDDCGPPRPRSLRIHVAGQG